MMTVVKTQLHEHKVKSEGRVVLPVRHIDVGSLASLPQQQADHNPSLTIQTGWLGAPNADASAHSNKSRTQLRNHPARRGWARLSGTKSPL